MRKREHKEYEDWFEEQDFENLIYCFLINNSEHFVESLWDGYMGTPKIILTMDSIIKDMKDSSTQWGKDFDFFLDRSYRDYLSNCLSDEEGVC